MDLVSLGGRGSDATIIARSTNISAMGAKNWHRKKTESFLLQWTYVDRVDYAPELVKITFNPFSMTPGPFAARIDLNGADSQAHFFWEDSAYFCADSFIIKNPFPANESYDVTMTLDGCLVYRGSNSIDRPLPF